MKAGLFYTGVVLLFITFSVLRTSHSYAGIDRWTTTGPAGRSANALVVDPKNPATLYVGTEQGIFKSTDRAESWVKLALPFAVEVTALTIDPTNPAILYAGYLQRLPLPDGFTTAPGVLKSRDGGVSWVPLSGLPGDYQCNMVSAVAPTTPASVYLHCLDKGSGERFLFKSVDDGRSWTRILQTGLTEKVVVDPVTPTTIYVPNPNGTQKSVDGGRTWTVFQGPRLADPTVVSDLAIAPTAPNTIYASLLSNPDPPFSAPLQPAGTYKSTDGGTSWTPYAPLESWGNPSLIFDPIRPNTLYTVLQSISQTIDGGRNWTALTEGLPEGLYTRLFTIDPQNGAALYAGVVGGTDTLLQGLVYKRQLVGTPPIGVQGTLESPEAGQPVSGIGFLRGWCFSTRPDAPAVMASLTHDGPFGDGILYSCSTFRDDVQAAFPQFPREQTLNSGWGTMMHWGLLTAGSHRLQPIFNNQRGDFFFPDSLNVIVLKLGDFEFVDRFTLAGAHANIVGDELEVRGVIVQDFLTKQQKRIDVRYRWLTNQQSLGLVSSQTVVALSSLSSSFSALRVRYEGQNWLQQTPDLIPNAYATHTNATQVIRSYVESPNEGQITSGIGLIRGWAFADIPPQVGLYTSGIPSVRPTSLAIDGKVLDRPACCIERLDVALAYPDTPRASLSGWATQFNYGELDPGEHTLSIELQSWDGVVQTLTRKITTIRIGGFRFLDQFNLTTATARIEGEEIVLSGVQVCDKASQQSKRINVRLRWFQHSQSLGIVAAN